MKPTQTKADEATLFICSIIIFVYCVAYFINYYLDYNKFNMAAMFVAIVDFICQVLYIKHNAKNEE